MTEQQIQSAILRYLAKLGWYVIKTITTNRAGVPDIIACTTQGIFVGIEVKTAKGVVSELQKAHIQKIKDTGGYAGVFRSVQDLKEFIEYHDLAS
jgi:Holliday junction resolvase